MYHLVSDGKAGEHQCNIVTVGVLYFFNVAENKILRMRVFCGCVERNTFFSRS